MARALYDTNLQTRTARARLQTRPEPYWRILSEGLHIGYYRGARGGRWLVRHRKRGTTGGYTKSTLGAADDLLDADGDKILSFNQAQERARDWFTELSKPLSSNGRPYTIGDALDDYMASFRGKSVGATRSRIDSIIRPTLGHIILADLTVKQVKDWLHQRATSPAKLRTSKFARHENTREPLDDQALRRRRSTANRDLTVLKAALNQAYRDERVSSDAAWRKVEAFKNADAPRHRHLSDEEAKRLVAATAPDFKPMVQAALLTGARYGDLTRAKVRDFDRTAAALIIPNPKGNKPYTVYLEAEGCRLLTAAAADKGSDANLFNHPSGRAWRPSEQARYLASACTAAKIERATFHDLRRTYGARLARAGVPMAVIADAMGHADERITRKHYAHLSPSYLSATIRQYAAGLGIVAEDAAAE